MSITLARLLKDDPDHPDALSFRWDMHSDGRALTIGIGDVEIAPPARPSWLARAIAAIRRKDPRR